ncbi:Intraflagellar transport 81 calponin homology domain [Popillia japonica]|uniref:Intraflagellar transport 81 calponin homology domain n=1 Tax=Popillia japonica TaxID=7064 RepID=A0AAW1L7J1_POPJA
MARLQFIVHETNRLLGTNYSVLSFDTFDNIKLLKIVRDVLEALGANVNPASTTDTSLVLLSVLQSIKYAPTDVENLKEFCEGFASGEISVIYPVLEWLLTNQTKIRKRAYLAKYADKIVVPAEMIRDVNVSQCYKIYELVVGEFWSVYKEATNAKKEHLEAKELQIDIAKMNQDIKNLQHINQAQREKLKNIANKEDLLTIGRNYRSCVMEQQNLSKRIKENTELTAELKVRVKDLEDKWIRRGSIPNFDTNIVEVVQQEAQVNKIILETQLPQDFEKEKNLILVLEKTVTGSYPIKENLIRLINRLRSEIQLLQNEKSAVQASTEDKLGPFRKQSFAIAQKKQELSNEVNDIKKNLTNLDDKIRNKEISLFNVIGGEVLHGENWKCFISSLREKSIVYKDLRGQLQSLSNEQGVITRTLDVLKSLDPNIEEAYFNANLIPNEDVEDQYLRNVNDVKYLCKEYLQDIDVLKGTITRTNQQLDYAKKDTDLVTKKLDETKDIFEDATRDVIQEISQLKDNLEQTQNDIDLLEKSWRTTTQNLDKSENIFNQLIDEMINESDETSKNDSYLLVLSKKKEEIEVSLDKAQKFVRELEENTKQEQDTVEFFKHVESLILQKIEDNE